MSETFEPRQHIPRHPIQVAAHRAGLSAHAIRAWERRYGAVRPERSGAGRRLYSDAEIERLGLLRRAAAAGRRISELARLSDAQLSDLVNGDQSATGDIERLRASAASGREVASHFTRCLSAVRAMDNRALEAALAQAAGVLGVPTFLEDVLTPLMRGIGRDWKRGTLRVSHEHAATAVIRSFLGTMAGAATERPTDPKLLVTTPIGQVHELGALTVTVAASYSGWRARYLGPSLPAEEIAYAAGREQARVLALSISYPADDPLLPGELRRLHRCLDPKVYLIVGGSAARVCDSVLREIGAIRGDSLQALAATLDELRVTPQHALG